MLRCSVTLSLLKFLNLLLVSLSDSVASVSRPNVEGGLVGIFTLVGEWFIRILPVDFGSLKALIGPVAVEMLYLVLFADYGRFFATLGDSLITVGFLMPDYGLVGFAFVVAVVLPCFSETRV